MRRSGFIVPTKGLHEFFTAGLELVSRNHSTTRKLVVHSWWGIRVGDIAIVRQDRAGFKPFLCKTGGSVYDKSEQAIAALKLQKGYAVDDWKKKIIPVRVYIDGEGSLRGRDSKGHTYTKCFFKKSAAASHLMVRARQEKKERDRQLRAANRVITRLEKVMRGK